MSAHPESARREVQIEPIGSVGFFDVPAHPRGAVIFAHGSGSGRFSPRNNHVAEELRNAGIATLLLDLLTPAEERDRRNVFDIELLASRLIAATRWVEEEPRTRGLPIGYFGSSTGAGAALLAAAELGREISAVVSRGGRPDLAMDDLPDVTAPTQLIVGGDDMPVIALNRRAKAELETETQLVIVAGATHLFEEPGALDEVIEHAKSWFLTHFQGPPAEEVRDERPRRDLR
jgi:alpha-beta hydrolase superfamily lysophospholipase